MPTIDARPIQFRNNDGDKSTEATLFTLMYAKNELTKRALTRLGLCWLAAVGSIPIIFAHWVLVPGFLIAGPVMAVAAYKMTTALDRTEGICPLCETPVTIKLEPKDNLPKWTYCPNCNNSLQITD